MRGDEDAAALVREVVEDGKEVVLHAGVEAGEWLVEQHEPRAASNRASDQHAATLPAGKLADLALRESIELDAFEGLVRELPVPARPATERASAVPTAHEHDIHDADREVPVDLFRLRGVGHVAAGLADRAAEDPDIAEQWTDHTENGLEEC